jgi:hypothetical protein
MITNVEELLTSKGFDSLLARLEEIVVAETGTTSEPLDREKLKASIVNACISYWGIGHLTDQISRYTLHHLDVPLARVIEILRNNANIPDVLMALGAPAMRNSDQQAAHRAIARYEILIRELGQLARAVPSPPAKRGKGRPPTAVEFRALVEQLASYWKYWTGNDLTQHWHGGEPLTAGAQFIWEVVRFVNPERAHALPKVTEKVVAELNKRRNIQRKGWSSRNARR